QDCDDGDDCTADTCGADGCCVNTPLCTTALDCNDFDSCTTDTCGADGCCVNTPLCETVDDCEDRPCFDEECTASGCCGGMDKICEIIPPCTIQVCNPNTDECEPVGTIDCNDDDPCTNDQCVEGIGCVYDLIACCGTECSPITKAKFDLWNGNENRFSGTDRCISSWDQTLLSQYTEGGVANHFWRSILQTDRGKARIDGLYSPTVCGEESIDAPLLGVASKLLTFNGSVKRSGRTLVGIGEEPGVISYDLGSVPQPALGAAVPGDVGTGLTDGTLAVLSELESTAGSTELPVLSIPRAAIPEKGSLLAFTKVEMKWDSTGQLIQDSFIELTNDYPLDVNVKLYFVHGDLCIWSDNTLRLTANQAVYWSVASGQPAGVSPFTVLGEGCPDDDPRNPGGRRLRGYVLAWAVDSTVGTEIHWNHLSGNVLIVNYADASAWEYNAWAFRAVWEAKLGDPLLLPYGQLDLDGIEYQAPPAQLYFDFYGSGSMFDGGVGGPVSIDTDLTLWIPVKNLEQ
ncbi:MAG: hypothetical protein IID35_12045, partial [Planctomycetes bacterium]|nr:hypothetical protein [Planctomycetota bacterium]